MDHQTIGRKTFIRLLGGSALATGLLALLRKGESGAPALAGDSSSRIETRRDPRTVSQDQTL